MQSIIPLSLDKKFWLILLVPATYCIIFFLNGNPLVPDGVQYSDLGRSLFKTGEYTSSYGVVTGWVQPPLFPFFVGLFSTALSIEIAGHLVGIITAVLILIVLYSFLKVTFNPKIALLAILILSINPLFLMVNIGVITEPLYALLNLILFISIYNNIKMDRGFDYKTIVLIGILFAGLYSTRQEAILYFPLILYVLIKYTNFKKVLLFLSMAILLFSLYGLYSLQKMDEFKIAPKLTYSSRIGLFVSKYYSDIQNQPSIKDKNIFSWYGYDSTANAIYSENIMDTEYYENLLSKYQTEISFQDAFMGLIKRIIYNFYSVSKAVIISPFLPISFLLLVMFGLWVLFQKERRFLYISTFWLLPTLYFLVSHVEIRFFYVMLPIISIFSAFGLYSILNKVKNPNSLLLIVFMVLIFNNYSHYTEFYENRDQIVKYRMIANELKETGYKDEKICSKNFYVAFFGEYNFLKLPICSPEQLYNYMTVRNSDLLILDSEVNSSHGSLMDIYDNKVEKFSLITEFDFNNETLKMYKLNK